MNSWLGIGFVLGMLVTLIIALRWYKHHCAPHPELVRKLLHIGMGLTVLTFPWLFNEIWPILILAGITVPGLMALRSSERLKERLGGVIDGVDRSESLGEVCFPLGVAGLFILSKGDPLQYTIPILLLTLADALAALVGVHYGRLLYATLEGYKSLEGSLAFFLVAFLCIFLPLFIFSNVGIFGVVLIALLLALLMMLVEAIAWRGLDNLLIPVVGFLLLNAFLNLPLWELGNQLMLIVISVIVAI